MQEGKLFSFVLKMPADKFLKQILNNEDSMAGIEIIRYL
jgi:hypothetical protein